MSEEIKNNAPQQEVNLGDLLAVRRQKLADLQAEGKDPFVITKYDATHHSGDIKNNYAEYEGKTVSIAGRLMSKRVMGKASFCNVQDLQGGIQCYVARDTLGEDEYFVVGDNRYASHDSRDWNDSDPSRDVGPITGDMLLGRVHWVVWPPSNFRTVE